MFQRKSSFIGIASFLAPVAITSLAFLAVGCGGIAANQIGTSGTTLATTTSTTSTLTPTGTTGTGTNSPYSYTINGVGYDSQTVTVSTRSVLKVTFAPGIQDAAIAGTGVYPEYSKLGVYIVVGSMTLPTPMLENGYYGTAQTSNVIDFSGALSVCGTSTTCRETVTITITKPNNDYDCLQGLYCPWNQVITGQPWNGVLNVQTDDTTAVTGG
jgi:hypothetical protein